MLKYIGLGVLLLIAGVLVLAGLRPDTFQVRRSASIKAAPEQIFPLINDLHRFNTWNPFEKKDPNLKRSYSGPESGKGAAYAFDGNKDVGKGTLEILDSAPGSRVTMSLHMVEPFEVRNTVDFTLERQGDATNVTWTMQGAVPYFAKIIHLFVNMDRMVGTQFEAGLASLKTIAEKTP